MNILPLLLSVSRLKLCLANLHYSINGRMGEQTRAHGQLLCEISSSCSLQQNYFLAYIQLLGIYLEFSCDFLMMIIICLQYDSELFKKNILGAVMIVWQLDLQLPLQSVPITTNVVSLNPIHGGGRRDRDCMVVGFTTTFVISAYHH